MVFFMLEIRCKLNCKMKELTLLVLLLILSNALIGQNTLSVNLQLGKSIILKSGSSLRNLADEDLYIGDFSWNKESYTISSIGMTYETPTLKVLKYDWYLMTDLNLNYRNYGKNFYNILSISNDLYFPIIRKEQKLRFYLGIRNIFIISDFVEEVFRKDYPINNYIYGGLLLLDYEINDKLKIGLNLYSDLKPAITRIIIDEANYQSIEVNIKFSYLLKN